MPHGKTLYSVIRKVMGLDLPCVHSRRIRIFGYNCGGRREVILFSSPFKASPTLSRILVLLMQVIGGLGAPNLCVEYSQRTSP